MHLEQANQVILRTDAGVDMKFFELGALVVSLIVLLPKEPGKRTFGNQSSISFGPSLSYLFADVPDYRIPSEFPAAPVGAYRVLYLVHFGT